MLYEGKQLLYGDGNYIMYLRKSRKDLEAEQHGEGDTLTRHFNALNDLAQRMRLNVTIILEEIVSGDTIEARPKMQQLLKLVETCSFDGVLVLEVERLSRGDTADQGIVAKTLKYSGTKIITPYKIYDPNNEFDEEYFEFGLFMSRREYSTIKRRLIRGSHASRSEGKFIGSTPPYGYKIVKLKKQKGYTLEIVPEEAAAVRLIFDLASAGDESGSRLGRTKIADYLNEHGFQKNGKPWTPIMVTTIMINEVYKGYIVDGKRKEVSQIIDGKVVKSRPRNNNCKKYKGMHEPIVSEEQFDLVQELTRKRHTTSLNGSHALQNPFSGLVNCSVCGKQMVRKPDKKVPPSIRCQTRGCPTVSTYMEVFEKRVLEALKIWISDYQITPEEISSDNREKSAYTANIEVQERELEELNRQLEKTYTLLERGVYTDELFFRRNTAIRKEIDLAQRQLHTLKEKLEKLEEQIEKKHSLAPKVQNIIDCYYTIDSAAGKNALLKEVIDRIEYEKGPEHRGHIDSFSIKIYPKIK